MSYEGRKDCFALLAMTRDGAVRYMGGITRRAGNGAPCFIRDTQSIDPRKLGEKNSHLADIYQLVTRVYNIKSLFEVNYRHLYRNFSLFR